MLPRLKPWFTWKRKAAMNGASGETRRVPGAEEHDGKVKVADSADLSG